MASDTTSKGLRLAVWVLSVVVPPPVLAAFLRGFVRRHPVLFIMAVIVYWVALVIGSFVAGIGREIVQRHRAQWVEALDRNLGLRLSRFKARYRAHLAASQRFIDQKGLATIGAYTPELDEVFIDVSLAPRPPRQIREDLLADAAAEPGQRKTITEFLDRQPAKILAIVGAPGSGKTTLLRHTVRQISRSSKWRRDIPVLLYLRDHVTAISTSPSVSLDEIVPSALGGLGGSVPAGWFARQMRGGRCVVLLDGLDEIAGVDERRAVADWIERLTVEYPGNDYVITSRPRGYGKTPVTGATVLQARRFTDDQIATFIDGWYLAVERHVSGDDSAQTRERASAGAEDLRARLRHTPSLYDLTVNPLLLTMIANVHRYRGALPGSRADLYSEICQATLWRREEAKNLAVEPRGSQKEMLLAALAYQMMRRRARDITSHDAAGVVQLAANRVSDGLSAQDFLANVSANGLLIERESGVYSFSHHTFQEFLASVHIKARGLVRSLAESVDDDWWRECTLLYAASSDVSSIVTACLSSGTVPALALAFDCADEGNELDPQTRTELNALLADPMEDGTDASRRRLMTAVIVARQLRALTRTSSGTRICTSPVSANIFGMFQGDARMRGECHSPDGPQGSGEAPVVGIRSGDAAGFVLWVNDLLGGDLFYRLPTEEELEDKSVQRILPSYSFWSRLDGQPELWVPAGSSHPRAVSGRAIQERVRADLQRERTVLVAVCFLRARSTASALLRLLGSAARPDLDMTLAGLPRVAAGLRSVMSKEFLAGLDCGLGLDVAMGLEVERIQLLGVSPTAEALGAVARILAGDIIDDLTIALVITQVRGIESPGLSGLRDAVQALGRDLARDDRRGPDPAADSPGRNEELRQIRESIRDLSAGYLLSQSSAGFQGVRVRKPDPDGFIAQFSDRFIGISGAGADDEIAQPELLERSLASAVADAQHLFSRSGIRMSSVQWATQMTDSLGKIAAPVFRRTGQLTPSAATSTRLLALCLAAEADAHGYQSLGRQFRLVAAGITWLEHRRDGTSPATEALVLARD